VHPRSRLAAGEVPGRIPRRFGVFEDLILDQRQVWPPSQEPERGHRSLPGAADDRPSWRPRPDWYQRTGITEAARLEAGGPAHLPLLANSLPGQTLRSPGAGHDTQFDLGLVETGCLGRDNQVAQQGQLAAAAVGIPGDRRDQGFIEITQPLPESQRIGSQQI
jgi:hypothetical protein